MSLAEKSSHQSTLIEILKAALEPNPIKKKIEIILDYLLSLPHLQFDSKAALFFVEQDSETLALVVSRGFAHPDTIPCSENRFGVCHCGQVAETCKITFFNAPPPLLDIASPPNPFAGNYCVPIIKDSQSLGILTIYVNKRHRPSPEMHRLLGAVANIFAVMIESQQMDQQLIQLVNDLRGSIISIREEKKFSESIIQGLHHGLLVVDLDGRVRKSNSVAKSIFNPCTELVDDQYLADILGADAANQLLTTVPSESDQFDRELSFVTPNGEKKIIGFSNVCREDAAGRTIGVIISLADISELKYVRKEMEKMNRLSTVAEIASAVAHEVRNPLAGIKIMAQSIEEEAKDNSEQLECAQRITRQVDRLNVLLSDFFSYARPAEPNKRPTSLETIIVETKPLIKSRLTKNHIELHEDISSELPKIIADPHQLQQVFLNLFLNGIDAIKQQGQIDISASLPTKIRLQQYRKKYPALLDNSPYVVVLFTDNGKGMSPATAEQVFEPFFTTKTSGAGLGLSIVYRTLKENDAAIVLESKEGKGTTFTMFFKADM
ncbi:MAG: GAF domain-containing protein [Desulfobulbaceae bacterium]|nr:GAF domain-containing protein [Desulfobulbaceae bacterium]